MKVTAYSYNYARNGKRVAGHALLFNAPGNSVVNHFEQRLPSGERLIGHIILDSWSAARRLLMQQGLPGSKPVDRPLTAPDVRIIADTWKVRK